LPESPPTGKTRRFRPFVGPRLSRRSRPVADVADHLEFGSHFMPLRSIPSVVARTDGRHYVAAQMKASRRILVAVGVAGTAVAFAACAHVLGRHPVGNSSVPQPAKSVDLEKYLGRWFEIARYEQRFQKGCTGVTADYSLRQDGSIDVVNRCRRGGQVDEAHGRAKVVDRTTNAKLKVSFFGPFYGHYWVLDHADDYSWSIVGEPSGRYLWILARSPRLPENEVSQLFARAQALGYNTSMLLRTIQA
jgi:apolipoprotein D and lipocalin family protein